MELKSLGTNQYGQDFYLGDPDDESSQLIVLPAGYHRFNISHNYGSLFTLQTPGSFEDIAPRDYLLPVPQIVATLRGNFLFCLDEEITLNSKLYIPYLYNVSSGGTVCSVGRHDTTQPRLHSVLNSTFNSRLYTGLKSFPVEFHEFVTTNGYADQVDYAALEELDVETVCNWSWNECRPDTTVKDFARLNLGTLTLGNFPEAH